MFVRFNRYFTFTGPHLTFEDEVTSLQPQVNKLLTLGVNKIIALGHSGFTVDQDIAKRVRGVDVVIGGHTNTFLFTGEEVNTAVINIYCLFKDGARIYHLNFPKAFLSTVKLVS